jgi:hypothetical protein
MSAATPSAEPIASEPTSPMNICAGYALNQRKTQPRGRERAAENGELAGARDMRDLQVLGEVLVAGDVGEDTYVLAAIMTGPIARPSSPSVRLTAFAAPAITIAPNGM